MKGSRLITASSNRISGNPRVLFRALDGEERELHNSRIHERLWTKNYHLDIRISPIITKVKYDKKYIYFYYPKSCISQHYNSKHCQAHSRIPSGLFEPVFDMPSFLTNVHCTGTAQQTNNTQFVFFSLLLSLACSCMCGVYVYVCVGGLSIIMCAHVEVYMCWNTKLIWVFLDCLPSCSLRQSILIKLRSPRQPVLLASLLQASLLDWNCRQGSMPPQNLHGVLGSWLQSSCSQW